MTLHLSGTLTQTGYRCISRSSYSSSSAIHLRSNDPTDPTRTVFIPRSKFPPNHDPKTELTIQEDSKFAKAYLEQDPTRKSFVIHDGPPFANGQIHLGHAINKILKDIAARHAMITGHRVEFITGWDCHGLPIEMQVLKIAEDQQRQSNYGGSLLENAISPEHFRAKARTYAKSQIDLQMASFKRMGLLTDWNKRYTTDDPSYVANQLRAFSHLYEQKLIFKDLMPVSWSIINKTTVAEADIEYRPQHISKSAYILYEIIDPPYTADMPGQPLYSLIWTTTPWTLLENQAIAFNSQETYCIVKAWKTTTDETKNMVVSLDTVAKIQSLLQRLGYQSEVKTYVPGKSLVGLKYKPLLDSLLPDNDDQQGKPRPFLDADFIDGAKGTGLVHLSPQYGHEDFALFKEKGIPVRRGLVDSDGNYCNGTGLELAGKSIFGDGNQEILNLMDKHQALLFTEYTQHSYPYETRTNHPVMVRASPQIFMDTSRIVPRCLKALESSSFFPEGRGRQFINILASRPNWCISRQRLWGTPIPVLYDASDIDRQKMITHPLIIEHFCRLLYKRRFMDYWWTVDNQELIPQELLDKCKLPYKSENLVRGNDIFDVWSDSGLSWHTTTNSLDDRESQADIYLEGYDQLRGWFSSSCILSIALRGCLPSKRFIAHGFALHHDGQKMSKSQGNVVDPIKLFEKYGVDPVRLWAAKSAGACSDVHVKQSEFESSIKMTVQKVRLTLKYLIGALAEHQSPAGKLDHTKLEPFDQYYLDKLYRFASTVDEHYRSYRYDLVALEINSFLVGDLSPIYINTIKDLLYCDESDSKRRKSCLTVLNVAYNMLLRCLYPIMPHIVHEATQYLQPTEPIIEWQDLGYKASWKNDVLHGQFEMIVRLQDVVAKIMGKKFNTMQDHDSFLSISDKKLFKYLVKTTNSNPNILAELFRTSDFILSHDERLKAPDDVTEIDRVSGQDQTGRSDEPQDNEKKYAAGVINVKLLTSWTNELAQDYRIGGSLSVNNGNPIRFEMCYKKSSNTKCTRCRRYCVLKVDEQANVCDRCRGALLKLEVID